MLDGMMFRCKIGTQDRQVTELAHFWFRDGRIHCDGFDFGGRETERYDAGIRNGVVAFSARAVSDDGLLEWSGSVSEDPESGVPWLEGGVTCLGPEGRRERRFWFHGERVEAEAAVRRGGELAA